MSQLQERFENQNLAINQNEILPFGYYQSFPKNVFEARMKSTNS